MTRCRLTAAAAAAHPGSPGAHTQEFKLAANGSVFSPSKSGIGYCLEITGNGTREGNPVIAVDCGPPRRSSVALPAAAAAAAAPLPAQPAAAEPALSQQRSGSCTIGAVTCYKDHIPGPKGPYTNLLNVSAEVPAGAKLTLEYCAQLCHDYNMSVKPVFLSHLYIKTIILPRQARDKHRESSKQRPHA
jgi:hypothetical protein